MRTVGPLCVTWASGEPTVATVGPLCDLGLWGGDGENGGSSVCDQAKGQQARTWSTIPDSGRTVRTVQMPRAQYGSCKRPSGLLGPMWGWGSELAAGEAATACGSPGMGPRWAHYL